MVEVYQNFGAAKIQPNNGEQRTQRSARDTIFLPATTGRKLFRLAGLRVALPCTPLKEDSRNGTPEWRTSGMASYRNGGPLPSPLMLLPSMLPWSEPIRPAGILGFIKSDTFLMLLPSVLPWSAPIRPGGILGFIKSDTFPYFRLATDLAAANNSVITMTLIKLDICIVLLPTSSESNCAWGTRSLDLLSGLQSLKYTVISQLKVCLQWQSKWRHMHTRMTKSWRKTLSK